MPNTLTNVQDIKVAQNALLPFRGALLPIRAFSSNFSPDPAEKLDTVRVPVVGAPTDFAGSYTANPDSTVTVIPVSLNRHKFKSRTSLRRSPVKLVIAADSNGLERPK